MTTVADKKMLSALSDRIETLRDLKQELILSYPQFKKSLKAHGFALDNIVKPFCKHIEALAKEIDATGKDFNTLLKKIQ